MRALLGGALAALTLCGGLGCEQDPGAESDGGPPPDAGDGSPCGEGVIDVTLGADNPFTARPDHRFVVDQGLQGGYHIDISLRTRGRLDPDHVDIQIDLIDGSTRIARHLTTDWLLHIDPEGPWCDYPRARLVLVDGEGGLLPPERVDALVDRPLDLEVHLRSPLGDVDAEFGITVSEINRYR